jgi:hypothetical protein
MTKITSRKDDIVSFDYQQYQQWINRLDSLTHTHGKIAVDEVINHEISEAEFTGVEFNATMWNIKDLQGSTITVAEAIDCLRTLQDHAGPDAPLTCFNAQVDVSDFCAHI